MSDSLWQHFAVWQSFNRRVYSSTLTQEDIVGNGTEKYIDQVFYIEKGEKGKYNVMEGKIIESKAIFLDKNGIKYILPSIYRKHFPLNPKAYFECYLKNSDKTIYRFITEISSVKISSTKTRTFKELIEAFNAVPHSDPRTWQFLKIQAIASKAKGGKYRLCSEPATGKGANDTIIHLITNDNVRVSKPTLAKLETLFFYNQKVLPDEMSSLTPTQVRDVEGFFLTIADESPTFTKHSMAQNKSLNEVDIGNKSCVFTYNDRQSLHMGSKFFDDIWQSKRAFFDRYPALYLEGRVEASLPKLSRKEAEKLCEEHFEELRDLAKNLVYYFENMSNELHGWNRDKMGMKRRHLVNFQCVIDALDVYSESQSEFDDWMLWINKRVSEYKKRNEVRDESQPFAKYEEEEV